ncbi:MAG TPA: hypothetical protein PKD85_23290 [Saprospiraceae bacterium]|nr:hypothetical protein [Saprospiraceae bacterium]
MNSLYLICPTDFLELTIDSSFEGNKFFYTSLGNSIDLENRRTIGQIKFLLRRYEISKITFILKINNTIIQDITNYGISTNITSTQTLFKQQRQEITKFFQPKDDLTLKKLCISTFLLQKTRILCQKLGANSNDIEISALLYMGDDSTFVKVFPIVDVSYFGLN